MSLRISAGLSHRLKPALRAAMAVEKLRRVFWCSSPLQWGYVSGTVGLYRRADGAVYAIFAGDSLNFKETTFINGIHAQKDLER